MQKKEYEDDVLMLGGHPFHSRFILGSGKFSLSLIQTVMEYGGSEIATIALRRANADSKEKQGPNHQSGSFSLFKRTSQ